jgi:hypothetical protein
MRKLLLATTALVALNVSAAHADISISTTAEVGFVTSDMDGDSSWTDGNVTITGSMTTDSGLDVSAVKNMAIQHDSGFANDDGVTEDAYIHISGEFGNIRMGQTDLAGDRMDGVLGKNKDVYTIGATNAPSSYMGTDLQDNTADTSISFVSPSMNGLTVYGAAVPDGQTQLGVNFSLGGISAMVQSQSESSKGDEVSVGLGFTLAGLSLNMGKKEEDLDGVKIDSSDFNVGYTLNEATKMSVLMQEGKDTDGRKDTMTGIEVAYDVAPGMTIYVGYESTEVDSVKDNGMGAVLSVSF